MEPQFFLNPISPFISHVIPALNHHQNPPLSNSDDQSIESVFSHLNLSSGGRLRSHATSSSSFPASIDDGFAASIAPPMAFEGRKQVSIWAQSQISNGSFNGPSGLPGSHQRIDMGPDFVARGSYIHAGDHMQLMNNQRHDSFDGYCDNFGWYVLHGKEPIVINSGYEVPALPFALENSSWNSLCNDQQLYKPYQLLTFDDMRGSVVSLAKDEVFGEILISKLEMLTEKEIDLILMELEGCWGDLLRDQFGSQFVQKLFVVCKQDQRTRIFNALVKSPYNLVTVCLNYFGSRAVQKLLEKLNTPQQVSLVVTSLTHVALALAIDPNGLHVLSFCVKRFPPEYTKHLLYVIGINCYRIATNKSGCCVLQSCLENSCGEAREHLISEIIATSVHLAEDPYGNYVVQYLLGLKMQEVTDRLLQRFQGYFLYLSCNKYASNVVEKMLKSGDECCTTILMEILSTPNASMLLVDPFGNFVIQSALSASKGEAFELLLTLIEINVQYMQRNLYGRKILAWFTKMKPYNAWV